MKNSPHYPYIYRHRFGTMEIYAASLAEAEARAKRYANGMRIVLEKKPEWIHEARH